MSKNRALVVLAAIFVFLSMTVSFGSVVDDPEPVGVARMEQIDNDALYNYIVEMAYLWNTDDQYATDGVSDDPDPTGVRECLAGGANTVVTFGSGGCVLTDGPRPLNKTQDYGWYDVNATGDGACVSDASCKEKGTAGCQAAGFWEAKNCKVTLAGENEFYDYCTCTCSGGGGQGSYLKFCPKKRDGEPVK